MAVTDERGTMTPLRDGTTVEELVDETAGRVSRRIYTDPDIYELEQERLFRRAWGFLGHESEIANPGDVVTRTLAGEPVLLMRDDDGAIRAFLNSCRHRGMRLCRVDRDNVNYLRCPYHGWTYGTDGTCLAVFAEECYEPDPIDKSTLGLYPVNQVGSYHGMIFGSWNADAPSLDEYLGDMRFYLDMLVARTPGGAEVVGVPQVWDVETNWKFAVDNFTGDNFHLYSAHGSVVDLGMLPPDPMSLAHGHLVSVGNGHQLHVVPGPPDPMFSHFGLPPELRSAVEVTLSAPQSELVARTTWSVGTVYPNLSYMQVLVQGDLESPMVPFLNFRMWVPTGATSTRVWSWFFIERDASPAYRRQSYEAYVRTFGPSGIFEQDDMENWEECTRVNSGKIVQRYPLNHQMGLAKVPDSEFIGPGDAYPGSYGERTQLAFYGEWQRWLTLAEPWTVGAKG